MNLIVNRWNQLDLVIILLSIVGIVLEEMDSELPINPTIIRVMRVLRIARGGCYLVFRRIRISLTPPPLPITGFEPKKHIR